jgi:hypothetical protein
MAVIQETAYPRLKRNYTKKEIVRVYTPSQSEYRWVKMLRVEAGARLAYLVMLKCFQMLGYFPKPADIPVFVVSHIGEHKKMGGGTP